MERVLSHSCFSKGCTNSKGNCSGVSFHSFPIKDV